MSETIFVAYEGIKKQETVLNNIADEYMSFIFTFYSIIFRKLRRPL